MAANGDKRDRQEASGGGGKVKEPGLAWFGSRLKAIVSFIGVPVILGGVYYLYSLRPADIRLALTTCHPYQIVLKTSNLGGRSATVGPPRFAIVSPRRRAELDMLDYRDPPLPEPPGEVKSGEPVLRPYDSGDAFFAERESAPPACRLFVMAPVTLNGGRTTTAWGSCQCDYVR
jgi:hypothetical protein